MSDTKRFDPNNHLIRVKGGAEYLEVKWRLVWFRKEHPEGRIFTEVQEHHRQDGYARVKARVECLVDGEWAIAESTGTETIQDFPDYLEKSETKAIGRALAALGYGTQFAEDFEMVNPDGSPHYVDAPVEKKAARSASSSTQPASDTETFACEGCGEILTPSPAKGGKKGMTAREKADFSIRRVGKILCYECYQTVQGAA